MTLHCVRNAVVNERGKVQFRRICEIGWLEDVKKSNSAGKGRRKRLPHHSIASTCSGQVGQAFSPARFLHSFLSPDLQLVLTGNGPAPIWIRFWEPSSPNDSLAGRQHINPIRQAVHYVHRSGKHPEWMGYKKKLPEWLKQTMR